MESQNIYCVALKKNTFFTLCWLYSALYAGALCYGFILGFILWLYTMALFWALYWVSCRWAGASVASVASGAVLATAGTHRGAAPQLGNSRAPGARA